MDIRLANNLDSWEDILSEIDKEHIPFDVVKEISLQLLDGHTQSINVGLLRENGLGIEDLELYVSSAMVDAKDELRGLEFVIDVELVQDYIHPITYNLLRTLDVPFVDDDDDDDDQ